MKKNILYSIISGIVLCVMFTFVGFLPSLELHRLLFPLILLGSIIPPLTLLYKNYSFKDGCFRMLVMFFSCFIVFGILAISGCIETIEHVLHIHEYEANAYASGLGMVIFLIPIFCESVIINILLLIYSCVRRSKGD